MTEYTAGINWFFCIFVAYFLEPLLDNDSLEFSIIFSDAYSSLFFLLGLPSFLTVNFFDLVTWAQPLLVGTFHLAFLQYLLYTWHRVWRQYSIEQNVYIFIVSSCHSFPCSKNHYKKPLYLIANHIFVPLRLFWTFQNFSFLSHWSFFLVKTGYLPNQFNEIVFTSFLFVFLCFCVFFWTF